MEEEGGEREGEGGRREEGREREGGGGGTREGRGGGGRREERGQGSPVYVASSYQPGSQISTH